MNLSEPLCPTGHFPLSKGKASKGLIHRRIIIIKAPNESKT